MTLVLEDGDDDFSLTQSYDDLMTSLAIVDIDNPNVPSPMPQWRVLGTIALILGAQVGERKRFDAIWEPPKQE
jgi:hypothetical protein